MLEIVMATHAGMTTEEFDADRPGLDRHGEASEIKRPYTEMVYQPMLELLAYLRANGFKTFIVSGGGVEFMRPWTEKLYGIPPEQVVGSSGKMKFEMRDGKPVLVKAAGGRVHRRQGPASPSASNSTSAAGRSRRSATPTATCRCSNGRPPARGARFALIVHHDDAEREYAYDRRSHIGKLDKAMGRGRCQGLDGRQHEGRLEEDLSVPEEVKGLRRACAAADDSQPHAHDSGDRRRAVAAAWEPVAR